MAIVRAPRSCSWPMSMERKRKKKERKSVDRILETKRTYLPNELDHVFLRTANFSFSIIDRKERTCDHRLFDFSSRSNFFIDCLVVVTRENEDHRYRRLDSSPPPLLCELDKFLSQVLSNDDYAHNCSSSIDNVRFDAWVSFGIKTATDESHNSAISARKIFFDFVTRKDSYYLFN